MVLLPRKVEENVDLPQLNPESFNALRCGNPTTITLKNVRVELVSSKSFLGLFGTENIWKTENNLFENEDAPFCYNRVLLSEVSLHSKPGQVLAILGRSGSGKTTLLNYLAGRLEKSMISTGDRILNGAGATSAFVKKTFGYVLQTDHLSPNLTVRETLQFAALLRMPSSLPKSRKLAFVEEVLAALNLRDCANVHIGDENHRGISGGEKRRVSIGVQLLTNPSVLLLDEPTTGLDSSTSRSIMELLQSFAHIQQRNIICTIHQPRSDIFQLFDVILLLSKGGVVYFGKRKDMVSYFSMLGFACPEHTNPADYFLDISSIDRRDAKEEERSTERLLYLVDNFKRTPKNSDLMPILDKVQPSRILSKELLTSTMYFPAGNTRKKRSQSSKSIRAMANLKEEKDNLPEFTSTQTTEMIDFEANKQSPQGVLDSEIVADVGSSIVVDSDMNVSTSNAIQNLNRDIPTLFKAFPLLSRRVYTNLFRSSLAWTRISQVIGYSLMLCLCYIHFSDNQASIQNRICFLYLALLVLIASILNAINLVPAELKVYDQERIDGLYHPSAFFLSYMSAEVPLNLVATLIFSIITYFVLGLHPGASHFFLYYFIIVLLTLTGESLGIIMCSLFKNANMAYTINNMLISFVCVMAGFFRPVSSYPEVFQVINYLSPFQYAALVLSVNEFSGETFTCPGSEALPDGSCPFSTGEQVLQSYSFDSNLMWPYFGVLICLMMLFRVISFCVLVARKPIL